MNRSRRVVLLLFTGSLLLQLAWIISLPPFRGIDEFDHAYRAAAVADGQWVADTHTYVFDGRGNLVTVPRALVHAARPVCYTYGYTGYANCNPFHSLGHGMVTVASGAARYNPLFYWLVGTPARPFQGAQSLEVMRLVASLLCSLMIAAIGWILTRWSTTIWPLVGMLMGLTPMVTYSSILPAANGVEMLAGFGVWAALLGVTRVKRDPLREKQLLIAAATMAIPLATVRSLGPLWLAMIVTTMFLFIGYRDVVSLLRRNPRVACTAGVLVLVSGLAGVGWTLSQSTNSPSTERYFHYTGMLGSSLPQVYLWVFQSFAAFPTRSEFPGLWIFALGFTAFGVFLIVAIRTATRRVRWIMGLVIVGSLGVPLVITLATFARLGDSWQGRYTLPYALGLPLLAGLALERADGRLQFVRPSLIGGYVLYLLAHLGGTLYVLDKEKVRSPLAGTGEWWIPPTWLVVGLIVAGLTTWALTCITPRRPEPHADASQAAPDAELAASR